MGFSAHMATRRFPGRRPVSQGGRLHGIDGGASVDAHDFYLRIACPQSSKRRLLAGL